MKTKVLSVFVRYEFHPHIILGIIYVFEVIGLPLLHTPLLLTHFKKSNEKNAKHVFQRIQEITLRNLNRVYISLFIDLSHCIFYKGHGFNYCVILFTTAKLIYTSSMFLQTT